MRLFDLQRAAPAAAGAVRPLIGLCGLAVIGITCCMADASSTLFDKLEIFG